MQDLQVFKELKSTNSILEKEEILSKYKDSEVVKKLLDANLNPNRLFQFNKMHFTYADTCASDKFDSKVNYNMFIHLLSVLENRQATGNNAKDEVFQVFRRFNKDEFELYKTVLLKAPIGVSGKTVNKIFPGLIPTFTLMLAPNEIADITKVKYPIYVQPKLDGYRCVYHNGAMWSRSGKSFANKNLDAYFASIFNQNEYTLDGELYVPGAHFNKLQTILNTVDAPLPPGLKYFIYDIMAKGDWDAKMCKKPYSDRYKLLNKVVAHIGDHQKVIAIGNDKVNSSKEIVDLYKNYLEDKLEGVMLKDPEGLYQWKRVRISSGEMLKVKPYTTEDLKVTGVYAGEGKYEGMAGGMVLNYNGVAVRCGSGLDDVMRKEMAERPNDYIGKVAEIRYLEVTEDGSLRHPSFLRWREEKD